MAPNLQQSKERLLETLLAVLKKGKVILLVSDTISKLEDPENEEKYTRQMLSLIEEYKSDYERLKSRLERYVVLEEAGGGPTTLCVRKMLKEMP